MKLCHKCGAEWTAEQRSPARTETCAACGYDLHCCLNCKLYDPRAPNQCKSRTTELVLDKEKANFCDEFIFAEDRGPQRTDRRQQKSRERWKNLFGDG